MANLDVCDAHFDEDLNAANAHLLEDVTEQDILDATTQLAEQLSALDVSARKRGLTVVPRPEREELVGAFWSLMSLVDAFEAARGSTPQLRERFRAILGPWFWRSRFWNRSFVKPHGYAGDYQIIEWMYDLEQDDCEDVCAPAIVNCLDYLYFSVHSVQAVWERRGWFAELLRREHDRLRGHIALLDVAAGGARYVRDYLASVEDARHVRATLVDQDASAMAFVAKLGHPSLATRCLPIRKLAEADLPGPFDVVTSAGLFDYLDDAAASGLLAHLATELAPGGVMAISNFHPQDRSRTTKEWLVDWPLVFRDEADCRRIFPAELEVRTCVSANGALTYAWGRARGRR